MENARVGCTGEQPRYPHRNSVSFGYKTPGKTGNEVGRRTINNAKNISRSMKNCQTYRKYRPLQSLVIDLIERAPPATIPLHRRDGSQGMH
jgi:hypothetical protein